MKSAVHLVTGEHPGADRADWAHLIAHAAIGPRSAAWEDEGRKDALADVN